MRDLQLAESDQSLRELQFCTYDGVFIWKIADFTRRRQDAVGGRAPAMFSPGKVKIRFKVQYKLSSINSVCCMLSNKNRKLFPALTLWFVFQF